MNLTVPNLLSLSRMGLIPLFVIALLQQQPQRALAVFAIAGITDALDGLIARYLDQQSVLGAYLDPIADKLLLTTAFVILAIPNTHGGVLIPLWITVLVLARDVTILVVSLVLQLVVSIKEFPPMKLSKINTVFQIATIILVLVTGLTDAIDSVVLGLLYFTAALTVLSGLLYIHHVNKMLAARE